MATYLQGVEDYIPQFQPFDPDLNFYSNVLQTKQTQYDTNWKALNNIYGQYFYSELSRDNNIQKKDELLKQIDFNLKRVSGLDLSLQQNVQQATQVFKPFYEDKFLMKDMAFTKNYSNKRNGAMSLKTSKDEKSREMYWDTGVKAMDYMREEFRNVSDEESLNFQNVSYTPYKNVTKMYLDLAKSSGLKMETPSWSADGRYKILTRNGEQLQTPLTYLFKSYASNDAQLQDIYRTQAYVNRQDYVYQNMNQFGGDKLAAERDYLNEQYSTIQGYVNQLKADSTQQKTVLDNNKQATVKALENNTGTMFTSDYLKRLSEESNIVDVVDQSNTQLEETVSDGSSTATTSSYDPNQDIDIELLRHKVDAGTAAMLMNKDISEAAYVASYVDYKVTAEADPYALESVRQTNREKLVDLKRKADEKNLAVEHGLKTGYYVVDYETGSIKINPKYDQTIVKPDGGSGASTPALTTTETNRQQMEEAGGDFGENFVKDIGGILSNLSGKNLSKQQMSYVLGGGLGFSRYSDYSDPLSQSIAQGSGLYPKSFQQKAMDAFEYDSDPDKTLYQMKNYPAAFLENKSASELKRIKTKIDGVFLDLANQGNENGFLYHGTRGTDNALAQNNINFEKYILHKEAYELVTKKNTEILGKALAQEDPELSKLYYNNGNPLDKETFVKKGLLASGTAQKEFDVAGFTQGNFKGQDALTSMMGSFGKKVTDLIAGKDFKSNFQLTPEQSKKFNAYMASVKKSNPQIFNDANRRERIIDNWYKKEFNLTNEGTTKTYVDRENELSDLYDRYKTKLVELTASNKLMSLTSSIDNLKKEGGKYAVFSTNTGTYVNLNAPGTPGYNTFVQFNNDFNRVPISQFKISFDGNNKTGFDEEDKEDINTRQSITKSIIGAYMSKLSDGEGREDPELFQSQIANESSKTGAMVFYPKMDVLKDFISTKEKPNLLTADQAQRLVSNGITIAAPRSVWKNDLFMNNKIGALESMINMGEPIKYSNPFAGGFEIVPDKTSSTGYRVNQTVKVIDDYTGKLVEQTILIPTVNYGKNLDETYLIMRNMLNQIGTTNINDYRNVITNLNIQQQQQSYLKNQPLTLKK